MTLHQLPGSKVGVHVHAEGSASPATAQQARSCSSVSPCSGTAPPTCPPSIPCVCHLPLALLARVPGGMQHAPLSLLGFLEAEVCVQARVFVGSAFSRASSMVVSERAGLGGLEDEGGARSVLLLAEFEPPQLGLTGDGLHPKTF